MHCSISLFPNLLYMFQSMFSRELVGGSSLDTQMATSMYLLFSIPHTSLTQQTCRLKLCCSET